MHKWFTASGQHVFWSEICNNVSYLANHDPNHKVTVSNQDSTITLSLTSFTPPYERLYYYGKLPQSFAVDGAVQTALFIKEYSSLTRCNPNLIVLT